MRLKLDIVHRNQEATADGWLFILAGNCALRIIIERETDDFLRSIAASKARHVLRNRVLMQRSI
jgi:hypothetical protein